ncbi:MAG: cadherin-like beta sandwich domain-containing protein, partial [Clostridia bacterium]
NLRSEVHFTEPLFSAADYNMNGQITSNDLKLLNKLVAPTFYDENPIFSGLDMRLPNFAYHDGIFSATILKGNISGITSLRGILEYDSNTLEFSNGEFYSGAAFVEKLSDGKIAYTLLGLENENNDPRLLKLSFQVKSTAENTKFSLKEANIYKDGLYSPKNTEFSIDLRSNPTEMLKISSPSSTLDFDEKTTNYSIEVLDTEQYFDIDVSCPINGAVYYSHHELNEKLTTFKLIYEPFGAAPITYTFSINKVEHLSLPESNAYLKTLSLGKIELSPIFSSFVFFYTTKVDSKTVRVSLDYKPQADTTIIEIQGSTILSYGENIINIICTAANGNKIIYTIAITRPEPVISIDPNPNPSQNESETSPPQSSNESDAQSDNSTVQTPTNHKTLIILGCTLPFVCIAVVLFITAKRRKK